MSNCKHTKIQTWADAETSEPVALWSCVDCGRKFEPVDLGRDDDAARYRWLREDMTIERGLSMKGERGLMVWWCGAGVESGSDEHIDAAIDAARKAEE